MFLNMFHEPLRPFNTQYRCYSVSMIPGNERQDVERGGKIIMPPSALDSLTRLNIVYPMLFKLTNKKAERVTHCGVLEFVADEGKVYLPYWMMHNLLLEEGDLIQIESVSLPIATFSKFQPQSSDFLDITNAKAVLENGLRNFACLTTSDIIAIKYNDKIYELKVLETKPGPAVSIIECDMNVDFAAPVGYKEPPKPVRKPSIEEEPIVDNLGLEQSGQFFAFSGAGNRLDGRKKAAISESVNLTRAPIKRGVPDYDYIIGTLKFIRHQRPVIEDQENKDMEDVFEPFTGQGKILRDKNRYKL